MTRTQSFICQSLEPIMIFRHLSNGMRISMKKMEVIFKKHQSYEIHPFSWSKVNIRRRLFFIRDKHFIILLYVNFN